MKAITLTLTDGAGGTYSAEDADPVVTSRVLYFQAKGVLEDAVLGLGIGGRKRERHWMICSRPAGRQEIAGGNLIPRTEVI